MKNRISIILCALSLLVSCTDKEILSKLEYVESYIHTQPERAREELERMDRKRLKTRKGRAKFSLLYTMAIDKTDKVLKDDSTIRPALDYYRRHGTVDDRIKTLYYLGLSQFYAESYSEAIVSFTKAHSLLGKSNDLRFCGLVNQSIANTYMATYNDNDVIPYLDAAYEYFEKHGDKSLMDLTLYALANQYSIIGRYAASDSLYNKVIQNANIPEDVLPEVLSN